MSLERTCYFFYNTISFHISSFIILPAVLLSIPIFFETSVIDELTNGGEVALIGFGTFKVTDRAARTGRNPQTGKEIQIAASKVPGFKAGKGFKDEVNK